MDDKSNVLAVGTIKDARVECRIVEWPNTTGKDQYEIVWIVIKGDKVVKIDPIQAIALGIMEDFES